MDSRLCDSIRTSYSTICKIWNRTRAHLQNSIATFNQDGCLSKIYIRDFEGLRIDETQLNQMGYKTSHFHKKSRILTQSTTSVLIKYSIQLFKII